MSTRSSLLGALALALALLPAPAHAQIQDVTFADVTTSSFSTVWASSEPVDDATVRVFADQAGSAELTAGLEIELASSPASLALGLVKVRAIGLESDLCVYVQTLTRVGTVETAVPPASPFLKVCTPHAQERVDALGGPIANDILRLQVLLPDGSTPADGALVLVATPEIANTPGFARYPLSAFVGEGAVSGVARVNLNNLFDETGFTGRPPRNTVLQVTELRGLNACPGLDHHRLVRFRYVPDHREVALVGTEITELEVPEMCDSANAVCDEAINILDAQRIANLFGATVGECAFNSDLDVAGGVLGVSSTDATPGAGFAISAAAASGDGVINILDVQSSLNDFGENALLARELEQAKDGLCLFHAVKLADDELARIFAEADPATDAETVETATAFRALTRVLRPLVDGQANGTPQVDTISEVLERLGFTPEERDLFELLPGRLFNEDGTCRPPPPITALFESDVDRAVRAELLPQLEASLQTLEDFRSDWTTTCHFARLDGIQELEIDAADLLLLRSLEHALRAALRWIEAYDFDFDLGTACNTYNSTVPLCGDATRTIFAGGPGSAACRQFGDQATCEMAWHRTDSRAPASCFFADGECLGCGPNNEAAGLCTNTCGPPQVVDTAISEFLALHPTFATLQNPRPLADAAGDAGTAVDLLGDALSAMRQEPLDPAEDPLEDVVSITPRGEQFLDQELQNVLDSLMGIVRPAPPRAMCPVVDMDLAELFGGIPLRDLLPPFPTDVLDLMTLPDPTFRGVLPGATLDEFLCLVDSTAPQLAGVPEGRIQEPSPFALTFDIVDPPRHGAPGRSIDPASVRIALSAFSLFGFEVCTIEVNGVAVTPPDVFTPIDVTALLGVSQNLDGSLTVSGTLGVVGTPERGCFVDLAVEADDQSGNEMSEEVFLDLITEGAIVRFDPPGGIVPSPFTLTIGLEAPFGDVDALGIQLNAVACGEVIVNGTPLGAGFFGEIRPLLDESGTGAERTLTGTIATDGPCGLNVSADVIPFFLSEGAFYEVSP